MAVPCMPTGKTVELKMMMAPPLFGAPFARSPRTDLHNAILSNIYSHTHANLTEYRLVFE